MTLNDVKKAADEWSITLLLSRLLPPIQLAVLPNPSLVPTEQEIRKNNFYLNQRLEDKMFKKSMKAIIPNRY